MLQKRELMFHLPSHVLHKHSLRFQSPQKHVLAVLIFVLSWIFSFSQSLRRHLKISRKLKQWSYPRSIGVDARQPQFGHLKQISLFCMADKWHFVLFYLCFVVLLLGISLPLRIIFAIFQQSLFGPTTHRDVILCLLFPCFWNYFLHGYISQWISQWFIILSYWVFILNHYGTAWVHQLVYVDEIHLFMSIRDLETSQRPPHPHTD